MKALLLSDFGSTFTKLCAVNPETEEVIATASSFTTIETDIHEGFTNAFELLTAKTGPLEIVDHKACSSAAGGLRMLVSGLVPELTAEAAKTAALGAGAKVIKVFSHEMTDEDLELVEQLQPDIFLLTGGTDGGNKNCIIENAEALADIQFNKPIIVAGNRSANRSIKKIFDEAGLDYKICPNVMPKLGELSIHEVQEEIRRVFLKQIIEAKGLTRIKEMVSNILLPTPRAMLSAMELLSKGADGESGIGELLAVDPGGATTDVYSLASGNPVEMNTVLKGLPEPFAKRTVEGDIGMRYSLQGIIDAVGMDVIAERAEMSVEKATRLVGFLKSDKAQVPDHDELARLDDALVASAIEVAVTRHCGRIEEVYTPVGKVFAQTGKDLRGVKQLVITGGAAIHSKNIEKLARYAAFSETQPTSLRPREFTVLLDKKYILSAMGVLAQEHPAMALRIMKKELIKNE